MKLPERLSLQAGRAITMRDPRDGLQRPFVYIARSHEGNERYFFHAATADDFAFLCSKSRQLWKELSDLYEVARHGEKPDFEQRVRIEALLYELKNR